MAHQLVDGVWFRGVKGVSMVADVLSAVEHSDWAGKGGEGPLKNSQARPARKSRALR